MSFKLLNAFFKLNQKWNNLYVFIIMTTETVFICSMYNLMEYGYKKKIHVKKKVTKNVQECQKKRI